MSELSYIPVYPQEWHEREVADLDGDEVLSPLFYARLEDGSRPAREFIESLPRADQRKLLAMFKHFREQQGRMMNRQKFKQIEGEIFAFKQFKIRLACFRMGEFWYLTHGFWKKKNEWPEGEITRAHNIMVTHKRLESREQ